MHRAGDWFGFSSTRYCRMTQIYELEWSVMLDDEGTLTASAPCGGPFAISKPSVAAGSIEVYTASGQELMEITVPMEPGGVAALGWSSEEALMVLTDKLHLLTYELSGDGATQHHIKLLETGERESVSSVALRGCGCFVVTSEANLRGVVLKERKKPETFCVDISNYFSNAMPSVMEVMPPDVNEDETCMVYLAPNKDHDDDPGNLVVVKVTEDEIVDLEMDTSVLATGVSKMGLSYHGTRLAIYTNEGQLAVVSSDLQEVQYCINLGCREAPKMMHWCGPDTLFLTYSESQFDPQFGDEGSYSLLVPVKGGNPDEGGNPDAEIKDKFEKLEWNLDGSGRCDVVQEVDGVRVTTETACYFIEAVPECLVQLFGFQSQAPAANLANAFGQYQQHNNVEGFNSIRHLAKASGDRFKESVEAIIEAAAHEWDEASQTQLLGIATFGQSLMRIKPKIDEFKPHETSDFIVDTTKRLRVLNSVRRAECGMPLSFRQYQSFSGGTLEHSLSPNEAQILVNRLVNRKQFHLAYDVANFYHLKVDKILTFWANSKVQSSLPDDQIVREINSVLGEANLGFTDAAITAFEVGKRNLAEELLGAETRTRHQVLLFLEMKRNEVALQKAINGDEVDLTNLCFIKLLNSRHSDQQFCNVLAGDEVALRMFYNSFRRLPEWRKISERLVIDGRRQDLLAIEILKYCFTHPKVILYNELGEPVDDLDLDVDPNDLEDDELDLDEKLRTYEIKVKEVESGPTSLNDPVFDVAIKKPASVTATRTFTQGVMSQASALMGHSARWSNPAEPFNDARWLGLEADLLNEQILLAEKTADDCFLNETVTETIRLCFYHKERDAAEKIRGKFNVSEKKYWYLQLQAMCQAGDWDGIDKLGGGGAHRRRVKSPIGFLPFVRELASRERQEQAAYYVSKLDAVEERCEWYVKLDHFKEAIDDAYNEDALDLLHVIKIKAKNPTTIQYCEKRMKDLQ